MAVDDTLAVGGQEPRKKRSFTDALSNGPGTVITRLIIMAMPFMAMGSVWMGKYIVEMWGERVLGSLDRIDKRLDAQGAAIKQEREIDHSMDLRIQHAEDDIGYLKERPKH